MKTMSKQKRYDYVASGFSKVERCKNTGQNFDAVISAVRLIDRDGLEFKLSENVN